MQHRRSLSELEWCVEGGSTAPAHRSASALAQQHARAPARLARLHRLAHIMLLRDTHAAPHPARTPLDTFRGVKKILEPPRGAAPPFASCLELPSPLARTEDPLSDEEPRCASLPSSPGEYFYAQDCRSSLVSFFVVCRPASS